ncbi:MAG: HAMP domain-containing sensor histidine kinase [Gemmatimonadota bacterium]
MGWTIRLRDLPLRTKLAITVLGVAVAVLGVFTQVSFRYWKSEALAAAEQQALLAGHSARSLIQTALLQGRYEQAHRSLRRLVEDAPITHARVWTADGTILLSSHAEEEGTRLPGVWIPRRGDVPAEGSVHGGEDGDAVRAFFPVDGGAAALFEVGFSVATVRTAMDRGARLGLGLTAGSLLAITVILFTLFEREVVAPIERMHGLLSGVAVNAPEPLPERPPSRRTNEMGRLEASVAHLVEQEQAVRRLAQEQGRMLQEQQGLAEVGELAAEMAHEFKRPLASIRSALEVLEQEYVLEDRAQTLLGAVDGQLEKLSETMRDLFALAKPVELESRPVDVADVLDDALSQLAVLPAASNIQVERVYDRGAPPVEGDRRRLEQAFGNVLLNAVEAMAEEGGSLVLGTTHTNGMVVVEVTDTGPGIPPETVEKTLLPFYSTKPSGTGLGLPLVARIVAAHGGTLAIDGSRGQGTRVRIGLPVTAAVRHSSQEGAWPTHAS